MIRILNSTVCSYIKYLVSSKYRLHTTHCRDDVPGCPKETRIVCTTLVLTRLACRILLIPTVINIMSTVKPVLELSYEEHEKSRWSEKNNFIRSQSCQLDSHVPVSSFSDSIVPIGFSCPRILPIRLLVLSSQSECTPISVIVAI